MPCKLAEGPWALLTFKESVVIGWLVFHGASQFTLFLQQEPPQNQNARAAMALEVSGPSG
jgi:hypothetical protein